MEGKSGIQDDRRHLLIESRFSIKQLGAASP